MLQMVKHLTIVAVLCTGCLLVSANTNPITGLIFKAPFDKVVENFKKQCSDKTDYEKLAQVIQSFEDSLAQLTAADVFATVTRRGKGVKDKIKKYTSDAIDNIYPQSTSPIDNGLLKKYADIVFTDLTVFDLFKLIFGQKQGSDGLLKRSLEKACPDVHKSEVECTILSTLVDCLQTSFVKQDVLNQILKQVKKGGGFLGTVVRALITVGRRIVGVFHKIG